ncbi:MULTISPECIES: DUF4244 domain-containing protein [Laceyella]|nr:MULTISPECIES: DUF4244 domain-containing protein [Laceyella]
MKHWLKRVKQHLHSKRGASTVEYIIIIVAGALLAGLLLTAVNSSEIQQSLQEKVEEVLSDTPNQDVNKPTEPTSPQIVTSDHSKPPSLSDVQPMKSPGEKEPSLLDRLKQKTLDGIDWAGNKIDQGINWLGKQKDQILNEDIKRAINEPGAYFSEVFGFEDYKAAWDKLTSDPLGYAKDSWDNLKASVNDIIENPEKLIFDKEMFMEAWNGKDKNGKSIPLPNRLWNMVESLPTPVKLVKVGRIAKDTLVPDSCHCAMKNPKKDKVNNKRVKQFTKNGEEKFTKEILATKPKNSPNPEKWLNKGGSITIDDKGVWTYTNSEGKSVSYPDGYPDFSKYIHPKVKPVKIKFSNPEDRQKDFREANAKAGLDKNSDPPVPASHRPPKGYTWHHHQDGTTMMLVEYSIHRQFTHVGGISEMKK